MTIRIKESCDVCFQRKVNCDVDHVESPRGSCRPFPKLKRFYDEGMTTRPGSPGLVFFMTDFETERMLQKGNEGDVAERSKALPC